jgi:hypothetical protein
MRFSVCPEVRPPSANLGGFFSNEITRRIHRSLEKRPMWVPMVMDFVLGMTQSFVLMHGLEMNGDIAAAIKIAFWLWVGFVVPIEVYASGFHLSFFKPDMSGMHHLAVSFVVSLAIVQRNLIPLLQVSQTLWSDRPFVVMYINLAKQLCGISAQACVLSMLS